jgi:hypothetical protein
MLAKPFKVFNGYKSAGEYFGRDQRTIKKFEGVLYSIERNTLNNSNTIVVQCRICGSDVASSKARCGYCPDCDGHKEHGKKLRNLYKGQGNPNFVDGGAKQTFRFTVAGRHWAKDVKNQCQVCALCGVTQNLHAHHIVPVFFYPEACVLVENGIALCGPHHVLIHEKLLDIIMLPDMVDAFDNGLNLREAFRNHSEIERIKKHPLKSYSTQDLLRATRGRDHDAVRRMHPNWRRNI